MPNHHTRRVLAAAVGFGLLAVVHTWPLASDPARWSRIDNGDAALNMWAVSWVAHHLPRDPRRLFDGNIFFPERLTLAFSETMLVQGTIAIPVTELGGSPVLAFNVALLAGFALTGLAFCLLVRRWTGSWVAGLVAGSLAAFNAHTLVRLTHLQAVHTEFIALMLFALDRVVADRRFRHVWWLATGFVLQALASIYLLVFSTWLLLFAAASRLVDSLRQGAAAATVRLAGAAAIATLLLLPYLAPYYRLYAAGFSRAADEEAGAALTNYLSTGARLHYEWWSKPFTMGAASFGFPGVLAMVLVVIACSRRDNLRDPRFRMAAAAGLGCLLVSFAPSVPFYAAMHRYIPLFQAVRVPAHLSQIVLLMIAILAGFGVATLQRRWAASRAWPVAAAALVVAVNGEALRAPMAFTRFDGIPPVYDVLARERHAIVVEMPFPPPRGWYANGPYMVYSTRHWRPMLNGYSGFRPASYFESYDAVQGFPGDASLAALYARRVTHIVVHHRAFIRQYGQERFDAIAGQHSLQYVARDDDTTIYRLLTP